MAEIMEFDSKWTQIWTLTPNDPEYQIWLKVNSKMKFDRK